MTKDEFKCNVAEMVNESVAVLGRDMDRLLSSGAVDLETADMLQCRAAVQAFLLEEADQFNVPKGMRYKQSRLVSQFRMYM